MKGLRLTDLYNSIQGEGPRVGYPTTFIRFGGCNMRCPGWPCDTQYAIQPSMWSKDPVLQPEEVMQRIKTLSFTRNACITGGEPTMQPPDALEELFNLLRTQRRTVDVFTNGSLVDFPKWMQDSAVSVVMDWKLRGSGERERGIRQRFENTTVLTAKDTIKFVVSDVDDFDEALNVWQQLEQIHCTRAKFSAGAAWGKVSEAQVAEWIINSGLPWSLNVQVHNYIYNREERQI